MNDIVNSLCKQKKSQEKMEEISIENIDIKDSTDKLVIGNSIS